jgi:tetratricopeptide (TPR) repeat protein
MSPRKPQASTAAPRGDARASLAWRLGLPLALFVAALVSFWPCLSQPFVEIDDDANFLFNERFRGLDAQHLSWMWSLDGFHYGHWHPLTWTSFAIDYALYGGPQGLPSQDLAIGAKYHRFSLVVHALSVVLVYWLALRLLRWARGWLAAELDRQRDLGLRVAAAFVALTWGLHPLRTESIVWATERRDVLSTFFLLLATLAYLRNCAQPRAWPLWIGLSLLAYGASLLSKAWGMTFPVVLLALDVYPLRRTASDSPVRVGWQRIAIEKLAFVPFALGVALQARAAQAQIGAMMTWAEHGLWQRVAQACYGLAFYVWKTLVPTDLSCLYLLELDFRPDKPVYLVAQALVVAVTLALIALRRRAPALLAAWVLYGVLVSPVLGFSQSGAQKVADRYAYLATIPFSMLAAGVLLAWMMRDEAARAARTWIALGASAVLAAVLGWASNVQTRVWKDSETLFRHALAIEPHNYFVAHSLTVQLWKARRYEEAIEIEKQSVAAHPRKGNEEARYTLGQLYQMTGKPDLALEAWRGALSVAPDHLKSLQSLVPELLRRGDEAGALAVCEATVAAKPGFVEGWAELANVRLQRGSVDAALEVWQRQLAAVRPARGAPAMGGLPPSASLSNEYGRALLAANRAAEAEPYLVNAVQLDSRNIEFASDAALGFLLQRKHTEAADLLRQVVAAAPNDARARALYQLANQAKARR